VARRAAFVDSLRKTFKEVLLVDAGEFSSSPSSSSEPKSLYLLESMKKMGYDAINIGTTDLQLGLEILLSVTQDSPVPILSANLRKRDTGKLLFRESTIVNKGKWRIGVTGISVPSDEGRKICDSLGVTVEPAKEALARVLPGLRKKSDLIVLLGHLPVEEARKLSEQFPGQIDLHIVGVGTASQKIMVRQHGGALHLTIGNRGQAVGVTKFAFEKARPELLGEEVVLYKDFPEDPQYLKATEDFRKHLNELFKITVVQKVAGGRKSPDGHYYVGASNCAGCHKSEFEIWKETPHAHAFATLVERGSDAMPECFRCHVTGAGDPAGYDPSFEQAKELVNVQCEVCHDKGSAHSRDGNYGKNLLQQSCAKCHDAENSPDFDPKVYWLMMEH
jgi:hypothetical protein